MSILDLIRLNPVLFWLVAFLLTILRFECLIKKYRLTKSLAVSNNICDALSGARAL